jgi:myo-inositol-1(or 4)-monophosphatase
VISIRSLSDLLDQRRGFSARRPRGVALGHGIGAVIGSFGPVDHLAAMLIVREAGGVVLDEHGRDTLFPASGGVLTATNRHAADALYEVWREAIAR